MGGGGSEGVTDQRHVERIKSQKARERWSTRPQPTRDNFYSQQIEINTVLPKEPSDIGKGCFIFKMSESETYLVSLGKVSSGDGEAKSQLGPSRGKH